MDDGLDLSAGCVDLAVCLSYQVVDVGAFVDQLAQFLDCLRQVPRFFAADDTLDLSFVCWCLCAVGVFALAFLFVLAILISGAVLAVFLFGFFVSRRGARDQLGYCAPVP